MKGVEFRNVYTGHHWVVSGICTDDDLDWYMIENEMYPDAYEVTPIGWLSCQYGDPSDLY